ncbi:MAG TPA: diadenylate cyclase CdaA [Saprospiraceae bacterium]|nr:diadenylate cyclase CdaA [Saprospiraceae bacterium]HMP12413.1 diadenylate cyclase CdaA [Saprospiraceae bacterium]
MMIYLIKIGFLPIRIWDVLDVLIVGYLMYQLYRLLRGTIAFNIFLGVLMMYVVWWLVNQLKMDLLSAVLDQIVNVGVIVIIIIFQQEVRRFLLFLGDNALQRQLDVIRRFIGRNTKIVDHYTLHKAAIKTALVRMSRRKTGALLVVANHLNLEGLVNTGILIDAQISEPLLESIFAKESPLHDGAALLSHGKIHSASCVLPISENPDLPDSAGMRHRAAVGITEKAHVAAFVVSEENGRISFAYQGKLEEDISEERLKILLDEYYLG